MCTLSWKVSEKGQQMELFFSRDEQRSRVKAEPPEQREINDVQYLSPRDPAGGGSWIGVNASGVVVCLLNNYQVPFDSSQADNIRSRGLLVLDVLGQVSEIGDCDDSMRALVGIADYAPFSLVVFHFERSRIWSWDGQSLTCLDDVECPVTSSSWNSESVEVGRKKLFHVLVQEQGQSLKGFHCHQIDGDPESSVCMSREKTKTVSLTKISIDKQSGMTEMQYGERVSESGGDDAFLMDYSRELALNPVLT